MGGKGDAPAPPDFTPIAKASEKSADLSFQLGQDQLAWAKQQFGLTSDVTNKVVNSALQTQDLNNAAAAQDRSRYENLYQPLEGALVSDANDFANGSRLDQQQGRAIAQVQNQFGQARNAAMTNLEGFGVDPSSTRMAALDIGTRNAQATAGSAGANQAGQIVDTQGRALRSEAINVGRGLPGQIAQTYATGLSAGNQAVNSTLANTASGANTMGTATQWQGMGNQALGVWGNTLQMGFQDQMAQYNANQSSSSGIGSALGLVGGIASGFGFAEGGVVPSPVAAALPVAPNATTGGPVPVAASPSRGAQVDDIPARLNAGEFVMPRDVTSWYGEKGMQDMILKARKDQAQAQAKPTLGPPGAIPGRSGASMPPQGPPQGTPQAANMQSAPMQPPPAQRFATGGVVASMGLEGQNPVNNVGIPGRGGASPNPGSGIWNMYDPGYASANGSGYTFVRGSAFGGGFAKNPNGQLVRGRWDQNGNFAPAGMNMGGGGYDQWGGGYFDHIDNRTHGGMGGQGTGNGGSGW